MFKLLLNFIPGVGPFLSEGWTLLGGVGGYIAKHWIVFLFLGMAGTIGYQNFASTRFVFGLNTVPYLEKKIAQDQIDIAGLKHDVQIAADANKQLTVSIGALNTDVGQWKSISDGLQKKNDALQGQLVQMRKDTDKKIQNILNAPTPKTCEASIDFLRKERSELTW